jgi:predicted 3-demethylubiquinone-9 3-methyltransferase (glyoxalase superfamily)
MPRRRITPNLWFDTQALEAAEFYCSIFPDSRIVSVTRYPQDAPGPEGEVMTVEYELDGERYVHINGGPQFTFSEAVSFSVECADQAELDHYWERLLDGGQESQCGWLKDRYGFSWQVVPAGIEELYQDPDPARAHRAFQAMMRMTKLDIEAMRRAADAVPA